MESKAALFVSLSLALSVLVGCAGGPNNAFQHSETKSAVDLPRQPMEASRIAPSQSRSPSTLANQAPGVDISIGIEPSAAAMEKMLPYIRRYVYSDAISPIEIRPFQRCLGHAIFAALDENQRTRFESIVRTGEIYHDDMIATLNVFFRRAVANQQVKTLAQARCPQYSAAIAEM